MRLRWELLTSAEARRHTMSQMKPNPQKHPGRPPNEWVFHAWGQGKRERHQPGLLALGGHRGTTILKTAQLYAMWHAASPPMPCRFRTMVSHMTPASLGSII